RHTRFSRDWSSDVCSSDLGHILHEVLLSLCQGLTCDLLGKFQGDAFVVDGRTDRTLHEISVVAGELKALQTKLLGPVPPGQCLRSEERRVGNEEKYWWAST